MSFPADNELQAALLHALVRDETGDWPELQRRLRRRRTRGALRLAFVMCALSGLLVAQALGVTPGVGSLFGDNAPAPVKSSFARIFYGHGVDPATIRLAAQTRTHDGRLLRLWTGRSRSTGATCVQLQLGAPTVGAVGCGESDPRRAGPSLMSIPGEPDASMLLGGIAPVRTVKVRLGFADGRSRLVPTTRTAWVAEILPSERRYGHDLRTIQSLDAAGTPLATQRLQLSQRPLRPVTPWIAIARFDGRPLRVAKANAGGACIELHRADGIGVNTCPGTPRFGLAPPADAVRVWALRFARAGEPGRLELFGALPSEATSARVTLENGKALTPATKRGVFSIELPQAPASRPAKLAFLAADGRPFDSISLRGPAAGGLYTSAWHDARYTIVLFGHVNSLDYTVGPLQWPDGRITPGGPSLAMWK